ncbi:MAG: hypothetical protein M3Q07_06920 [Pseudobdellovibrionaceae bacterium]|nr:hypothetical protein [Pseudobdellovibrionaceae bacterium]
MHESADATHHSGIISGEWQRFGRAASIKEQSYAELNVSFYDPNTFRSSCPAPKYLDAKNSVMADVCGPLLSTVYEVTSLPENSLDLLCGFLGPFVIAAMFYFLRPLKSQYRPGRGVRCLGYTLLYLYIIIVTIGPPAIVGISFFDSLLFRREAGTVSIFLLTLVWCLILFNLHMSYLRPYLRDRRIGSFRDSKYGVPYLGDILAIFAVHFSMGNGPVAIAAGAALVCNPGSIAWTMFSDYWQDRLWRKHQRKGK